MTKLKCLDMEKFIVSASKEALLATAKTAAASHEERHTKLGPDEEPSGPGEYLRGTYRPKAGDADTHWFDEWAYDASDDGLSTGMGLAEAGKGGKSGQVIQDTYTTANAAGQHLDHTDSFQTDENLLAKTFIHVFCTKDVPF